VTEPIAGILYVNDEEANMFYATNLLHFQVPVRGMTDEVKDFDIIFQREGLRAICVKGNPFLLADTRFNGIYDPTIIAQMMKKESAKSEMLPLEPQKPYNPADDKNLEFVGVFDPDSEEIEKK